jgi:tetratricopeptide (TPR) repeat protein
LAWHFLEGDDAEQALRYTILAGDQAEKVFANKEAEQHYRQASELAREVGDEACEIEALVKLAGVLTIRARYDKALDALECATRLHQKRGDREGEARTVAQMGHVHFLRHTHAEGIARLRPLVDALEAEGDKPTYGLAALWTALARLYIDSGDYLEQLGAADRAIELAKRIGDDRLVIGAEVTRADALWGMGQGDEALQVLEELIPRAETAGDLTNLARALGNAAKYYARRGDFSKDRDYHTRVLSIAEKQGDRGQIILSSVALSENAFLAGDWEQSRRHLDRAEAIIRALGASRLAVWPFAARAWLALRQGDLEAASSYVDEALSLADSLSDLEWRTFLLRSRAEIELLRGHREDAWSLLQQADQEGCGRCDAAFLRTMSDVRLRLADPAQANELAAEAARSAATHHNHPDLVEALVSQGAATAHLGDADEAAEILARALELARAMPFPYGEARALFAWGEADAEMGKSEQARQRLRQAAEIFRRLGARVDEESVENALEALDQQPSSVR